MQNTDSIDARLLETIQRRFPLAARPFEVIGRELGISETEAIKRLSMLKSKSIIKRIGGVFNGAALGYSTALVAFRVEDSELDNAGRLVAAHSGVSHCYSRRGSYNLWFTLILPPSVDMQHEAQSLAEASSAQAHMLLPAVKAFKLGVFLRFTEGPDIAEEPPRTLSEIPAVDISEAERRAVSALQSNLAISLEPFAPLADCAGMSQDELLRSADALLRKNVMRRYAAVLAHRTAGYRVNSMVCWNAGDAPDAAGRRMASHPAVSHCYQRPVYADWPYSIYTMIHCRTEPEMETVVQRLASVSGVSDFVSLPTVSEYKKSAVVYFPTN